MDIKPVHIYILQKYGLRPGPFLVKQNHFGSVLFQAINHEI